MLFAALGARALDLGNPQLSMHSIRETVDTHDVAHAIFFLLAPSSNTRSCRDHPCGLSLPRESE